VLAVVIAVALIAAAVQWVLPWAVERGAEAALADVVGSEGPIDVRLNAHPAARMLLGRIGDITVEAHGVPTADLFLDRLETTVTEVSLSLRELLRRGSFDVARGESVECTIEVAEKHLNEYLWSHVEGLKDSYVELEDGIATVRGYFPFENQTFQLRLTGRFVPEGDDRVAFAIGRVWLDGVELRGALRDKLLEIVGAREAFIDLSALPVPLEVEDVSLVKGRLVIKARGRLQ